jgi:hypothetical protein
VWDIREAILEWSALLYEEAKERTFRAFVGQFTVLEDMLYIWIDSMCRAKLPVLSSLAIAKALLPVFTFWNPNHFRARSKQLASKPNAKNFKTYAK